MSVKFLDIRPKDINKLRDTGINLHAAKRILLKEKLFEKCDEAQTIEELRDIIKCLIDHAL